MLWTDIPIHLIDFEGNLTSGILEYGVVTLQGGGLMAARTRLCGAVGCIRSSDTAIHGLDERALSGEKPFAEEFEQFARLRETGPLGAHYAQAENSLLRATWPYPRLSPDFARPGEGVQLATWGPWIDTGRLYTQIFPSLPTGQLETLVSTFQLQGRLDRLAAEHCPERRRHYHAALYDALAAALLLLALGERAEFRTMSLPWLLQMSTADGEKRAALQQRELF